MAHHNKYQQHYNPNPPNFWKQVAWIVVLGGLLFAFILFRLALHGHAEIPSITHW